MCKVGRAGPARLPSFPPALRSAGTIPGRACPVYFVEKTTSFTHRSFDRCGDAGHTSLDFPEPPATLVPYSLETVYKNKKCQSVIAPLCQSVRAFGNNEL